MVGTITSVAFCPPTELRPSHDYHIAILAVTFQVFVKDGYSLGQSPEQLDMVRLLAGVCIPTTDSHMSHFNAQVGDNCLGNNSQSFSQGSVRVHYSRIVKFVSLHDSRGSSRGSIQRIAQKPAIRSLFLQGVQLN